MTAKSIAALNAEADANINDNTAGEISAADVRTLLKNLADSMANTTDLAVTPLSVLLGGTGAIGASGKALTISNSGTLAGGDAWTLAIAAAKTLTVSNTLTLAGTDGSTLNVGAGGTLGTAAFKNTGASGDAVPLLNVANTWSATQTVTPAANTSALVSTGYSLTGSNAQSLIDLDGTWNTSGTPTALKINITNTASNAASLLADFRVGGTSRLSINNTGGLVLGSTGTIISGSTGNITVRSTVSLTSTGIDVTSASSYSWNADTFFVRDGAANTSAQRNGTAAQFHNHYDTWASATDYHRLQMGTARATFASVSGATVTATGIIPDGAIVVGVTTKVTVSLGTGGGTTGYTVGDGADADRWGDVTATAAGTTTDNRDWTATTVQAFTAASDVVITAKGGNFNGTGTIYVSVQYLIGQAD